MLYLTFRSQDPIFDEASILAGGFNPSEKYETQLG